MRPDVKQRAFRLGSSKWARPPLKEFENEPLPNPYHKSLDVMNGGLMRVEKSRFLPLNSLQACFAIPSASFHCLVGAEDGFHNKQIINRAELLVLQYAKVYDFCNSWDEKK
jgi:hypothetical protein